MCEAEILQGSGKGHTHAYSHQLVPKNSNFRPRIFLVRTLWTVNDVPVEDSLERPPHYLDLSTQPNEPEKLLTSNIHLLSPQN